MKTQEETEKVEKNMSMKGNKKKSRLEVYKEEIEGYLNIGISVKSIHKLINKNHNIDYVYTTYVHYIKNILKS